MKSPLRAKPLNNPGDSLEALERKVLYDEVLYYLFLSVTMVGLAVLEWIELYRPRPPSPELYSVIAGLVVLLTIIRLYFAKQKLRRIRQGREGEKAVGQFLESLRADGAKVFHDIQGDGFNIDHVVIHPSGIYLIETKTLSKPDRGEARLTYTGSEVLRGGKALPRNPVNQVQAGARWLQDILLSSTGDKFQIRPVVAFPGWFIQPTAEARNSNVWVLNPKALPAFIANSQHSLSKDQLNLCAHHLTLHIRAS